MKTLLSLLVAVLVLGADAGAQAPRFIIVTANMAWPDGATSDAGEVEEVLKVDAAGYEIAIFGKRYVIPATNARPIDAEAAAKALLDQRARLYAQLNAVNNAATAQNSRPTQYNGRPLPRNWIDPKQADDNFFRQQQLDQQRATQAELERIRRELQRR